VRPHRSGATAALTFSQTGRCFSSRSHVDNGEPFASHPRWHGREDAGAQDAPAVDRDHRIGPLSAPAKGLSDTPAGTVPLSPLPGPPRSRSATDRFTSTPAGESFQANIVPRVELTGSKLLPGRSGRGATCAFSLGPLSGASLSFVFASRSEGVRPKWKFAPCLALQERLAVRHWSMRDLTAEPPALATTPIAPSRTTPAKMSADLRAGVDAAPFQTMIALIDADERASKAPARAHRGATHRKAGDGRTCVVNAGRSGRQWHWPLRPRRLTEKANVGAVTPYYAIG
jgi:hypothetical protein